MISKTTPLFWQCYRALPGEIKTAARKAYRTFRETPSHPSLRLERLRTEPRLWSVRITRDYRAVARRYEKEWVWFWIGSHKEFDRAFPK